MNRMHSLSPRTSLSVGCRRAPKRSTGGTRARTSGERSPSRCGSPRCARSGAASQGTCTITKTESSHPRACFPSGTAQFFSSQILFERQVVCEPGDHALVHFNHGCRHGVDREELPPHSTFVVALPSPTRSGRSTPCDHAGIGRGHCQ